MNNMISSTDECGNKTLYEYFLGNLVKVINPLSISDGKWQKTTTEFDYDILGRKILEKDCCNFTKRWSYNILGKITRIDYPNNRCPETFQYDLNGQLTEHHHRNGSFTKYNYDFMGRPEVCKTFDKKG